MISGLAQHVWLMITIRHPMTGLPSRSSGLAFAVFALSAAAAAVRFDNPMNFVIHVAMLGLMVQAWSVRIAVAYALLSLGIDLIAIPVEAAAQQRSMPFFTVWEVIGAIYILWRSMR